MTRILVLLLPLTFACASLQKDKTVCDEYRAMRCATTPECSMDHARGCRVCQCQPAINSSGAMPSMVPPDLR